MAFYHYQGPAKWPRRQFVAHCKETQAYGIMMCVSVRVLLRMCSGGSCTRTVHCTALQYRVRTFSREGTLASSSQN